MDPGLPWVPVAVQALADTHDTAESSLSPVPPFGLGFTDQPPARSATGPAAAARPAGARWVEEIAGPAVAAAVKPNTAVTAVAKTASLDESFTMLSFATLRRDHAQSALSRQEWQETILPLVSV